MWGTNRLPSELQCFSDQYPFKLLNFLTTRKHLHLHSKFSHLEKFVYNLREINFHSSTGWKLMSTRTEETSTKLTLLSGRENHLRSSARATRIWRGEILSRKISPRGMPINLQREKPGSTETNYTDSTTVFPQPFKEVAVNYCWTLEASIKTLYMMKENTRW